MAVGVVAASFLPPASCQNNTATNSLCIRSIQVKNFRNRQNLKVLARQGSDYNLESQDFEADFSQESDYQPADFTDYHSESHKSDGSDLQDSEGYKDLDSQDSDGDYNLDTQDSEDNSEEIEDSYGEAEFGASEDERVENMGTRIDRPFPLPLVTGGRGPYPGPKKVDTRRRRGGLGKPVHRMLILKPPMSEKQLAHKILSSPQLRLKSLPVLSSFLPIAPLKEIDKEWIQDNMTEIKDIMGFDVHDKEDDEEVDENNPDPKAHLDTLLYLALQHEESDISKKMRHTRIGHSRLTFLGEFVLELALAELLLQVYPRESPGSLRERSFGVTSKKVSEDALKRASLFHIAFKGQEQFRLRERERRILCKSVLLALVGAVYLAMGMTEVYRLLFETFGFDLDAKYAQPKERARQIDVDHVSSDFESKLTWKDIAFYKPPGDALFAVPRLFRACVPPGIYRFRKNLWDVQSAPHVMRILGYPLAVRHEDVQMSETRDIDLALGLQLCFLHPSMYKGEHPRFCSERLEYIGSKIQDVVMAERLVIQHLDAPAPYLHRKHRSLTINRICGRRLRMKRLHKFIMYSERMQLKFGQCKRLQTFSHSATQQAIHGIGYMVYGKAEVRRLMFDVFEFDKPLPTQADFNDMLASQGLKFSNTLQPTY